jgi:hypothetical protein
MRPLIVAFTLICCSAQAETQQERNERMNDAVASALRRVIAEHPPRPRPRPPQKAPR